MKGFLKAVVIVPFSAVFLVFMVANRADVSVVLDPFGLTSQWAQVSVPLFLVITAAALLGMIAGGMAAWWAQRKARERARVAEREVVVLRQEIERLNRKSDPTSSVSMLK